jgi:hypothetical protein
MTSEGEEYFHSCIIELQTKKMVTRKVISKCSITFVSRFVSLFLMLRESIVFKNA